MEYLQAALFVNHFEDAARRWRHDEKPVSCYIEKEGEPKFWDGGQSEILEEGTYNEEGQGWGVITWNKDSPPLPGHQADDQDLQIALALSEEDENLAKSLGDLNAVRGEDPGVHEGKANGLQDPSAAAEEDLLRDQELAKRFRDLDSVPHVPRVNAVIPPVVGGSEDKLRLSDRVSYYGLAERQMAGDGNCQFRALSDQLYRTSDHHMFVRTQVVSQLAEYPSSYSSYVPMEYNKYLENMARDGEWGDHVTLQAAADFYGMKISLITSFKETCFIEIIPAVLKSQRGLYLSFWSEIHYNSICLLEDTAKSNTEEEEEWVSLDD